MVPKRKRIPRREKDKVPSFSARIYRENEGSRSRRVGRKEGREGVVRVSVAIYPWGGIYLSSTRSSSVVTRPFAAPLPSLAPRNYVRNERKAPPGRGRGPFRRERRPVLLYAAWTLPPIEARQLFIRSQPRKTGHLVSLHFHRRGWGARIQRKVASIIRG